MSPRWTLLLLSLAFGALSVLAQATSADYFNKAAKEYIKEDRATALRTLDEGLRAHPGDDRLRRLAESLMKEQQQQQQQQQSASQQQNQQQEEKQSEQQQGGEERDQEQAQQQQEQKDQGKDRENQERKPGELTKEEAERMLDALERREQDVQQQVRSRMRPTKKATIEKDW